MDLNKLPDDMERQAILERLGWIFTRVRATEFLRDAERAMLPVYEKLEMLEIAPSPAMLHRSDSNSASPKIEANEGGGPLLVKDPEHSEPEFITPDDLIARVTRRAEELRQAWAMS
jgi:hypothetical protein